MVKLEMKIKMYLASLLILLSNSLAADTYPLGDQVLELPFERTWQAKTENPKSQLLFFDANLPNPRPVIQVALSAFRYPEDLSAFLERYKREKREWVTKQGGMLTETISEKLDPNTQSISFEMKFSLPMGEFHEWSLYHQCNPDVAHSLKMMIPSEHHEAMLVKWQELIKTGLCAR